MSIKEELTGNTRCRIHTQLFNKPIMVVQVEVHQHGDYLSNGGGRVEDVPVDNTFYRDATLEDISIMDFKLNL